MIDANSVVLKSDEKSTEENGLIWKTIAVEGDYKMASVNNQKIPKPMKFVSSGESKPEDNVYSLEDIKNSFDEKAFKHVSVPLDHRNKVHENTGWVKSIVKTTDSKGRAVLKAALDIKDKAIKEKILNGTIADVSMGLRPNHIHNKTGKQYKAAINHICLTNVPFLSDLEDFEFASFSDDENIEVIENSEVYYFDDGVEPTIISKEDNNDEYQTGQTQGQSNSEDADQGELQESGAEGEADKEKDYDLRDLQISFITQFKDVPRIAELKVEGAIGNVALVTYKTDDKEYSWAVPFTVETLSDGKTQVYTYNKVSFDTISNIEEIEEVVEQPTQVEEPQPLSLKERLQKAHESRLERVGLSDQTTGDIIQMDTINFSELGLEGEALEKVKEAFAVRDQKIAEHAKTQREAEVDNKITHLSDELGLKEYPGLLTYCKDIYLSDDSEVSAVVNFSDDESDTPKALTATDILDGLIERLPKNAEGRVNLSDQQLEVQEGNRPNDTTDEENTNFSDQADELLNDLDNILGNKIEG